MQARDYVVLRAIEVGLAVVAAIAVVVALNSGWPTAGAQKFSDWYASQVNGLLNITVVNTAVTLPQVQRADLPIPQIQPPAFSAWGDAVVSTPSPNTN